MPYWLIVFLLALFSVHLTFFVVLFFTRKDRYFAFVSLTFFFLVISYSLRLWHADWRMGGVQAFWIFRIAAWGSAAISIYLTVRRHLSQKSRPPARSEK
jgi:hypothetical protein